MTSHIDIKQILIVSLIAVLISIIVFPLLQTFFIFLTDMELRKPLTAYFLWGYSPLILAGIYLGFNTRKHIFISGAITGIIYNLEHDLVFFLLKKPKSDFTLLSITYGPLRDALFCGAICYTTFVGLKYLNKRGNSI